MAYVNRHNYEERLIDFSEGRLSEKEAGELMAFLEKNPDLFDEFIELSKTEMPYVKPEATVFNEKSRLRKVVEGDDVFDEFSWLCVARLEGDASPSELAMFKRLLESNPALAKEAALFDRVRLSSPVVTFSEKKSLKRLTVGRHERLTWYSIAAGFAATVLIVFVPVWQNSRHEEIASLSAVNERSLAYRLSTKSSKVEVTSYRLISHENSTPQSTKSRKFVLQEKAVAIPAADISTEKRGTRSSASIAELSPLSPLVQVQNPGISASATKPITPTSEKLVASASEYLSVGEYLATKISNAAGVNPQEIRKASGKAKVWEYAQAGISGVAKLFGVPVKVDKQYDAEGNLKKISIDTKLLAVSKTL